MVQAMDTMKNGLLGVNTTALEDEVPRIILKDRISSRVSHGIAIGKEPYQCKQELVKF